MSYFLSKPFFSKIISNLILFCWLPSMLANTPCEDLFSEHPFISFAKKKLGENWQNKMPPNWEHNVVEYTKYWNKEDTESFLSYLKSRIGEEDSLKVIEKAYLFNTLLYKDFKKRILFYEGYIGTEGVTAYLRKSLAGFHKGNVEEIKEVIEYLKAKNIGFTESEIIEIMKTKLKGFARVNLIELKRTVDYLTGLGFENKEIKNRIKKSMQVHGVVKLSMLKATIDFLKGIGFTNNEIEQSMQKNKQDFDLTNLMKLKSSVIYLLEIGFEDREIIEVMRVAGFEGLSFFQQNQSKTRVAYLKSIDFTESEIIEIMKQDLQGFARVNLSALKTKE